MDSAPVGAFGLAEGKGDAIGDQRTTNVIVLVAGLVAFLLYVFQRLGGVEAELRRNTIATVETAALVGRQNGRIGKLEQWRWQIIGALALLVAAGPFVFWALGFIPQGS